MATEVSARKMVLKKNTSFNIKNPWTQSNFMRRGILKLYNYFIVFVTLDWARFPMPFILARNHNKMLHLERNGMIKISKLWELKKSFYVLGTHGKNSYSHY